MKLVFGVVILCLLGASTEEMLKGSHEGWDANGNQVYRFQLWRLWDWDKPLSSQESLKLSRLAKTLLFRTKQAEELTSRKMIE